MEEGLCQTRINFLDMTKPVPVFYFYRGKPRDPKFLFQYLEPIGWTLF